MDKKNSNEIKNCVVTDNTILVHDRRIIEIVDKIKDDEWCIKWVYNFVMRLASE